MMMDSEMMGGHMVWMYAPILALVIFGVVIAWFLRSPPKAHTVEKLNRRSGPSPHFGAEKDVSLASEAEEHVVEEKLLIVIPDISGYTRFITKSRLALAHAHFVIEELLDAIMAAGTKHLTPMRIEGDAIVFHSNIDRLDRGTVGETLVGILEAFYQKRAQLKHDTVCRCSICSNIAELDLKIIVHAGDVLRFHMGDFEDATGEAMIEAHHLLKGVSQSHRYILVSDAAFSNVELSNDWKWTKFESSRQEAAPLPCHLVIVPDDTIDQWDRCGGSRRSISDFLKKLASLKKVELVGP